MKQKEEMDDLDEDTKQYFKELGYPVLKLLKTGELATVHPFLFTCALMVGLNEHGGYRTRFCYDNPVEAVKAFVEWNGEGDPPGPWIKQKPEDRVGPNSPIKFID